MTCNRPVLRFSAVITAALLLPAILPTQASGAQKRSRLAEKLRVYQKRHRDIGQQFALDVEKIAKFCDEKQLQSEAAALRKLIVDAKAAQKQIVSLPKQVRPAIPPNLRGDERSIHIQLRKANQDYANRLYGLSRNALHAGFSSYAYRLVREVARHNSDHIAARRLLGHVRNGQEWVTPYAKKKADRGYVWHDKFGWLQKANVAKYENGMRLFRRQGIGKGRWVSAARDAALHADFRNPWIIRTEHYKVKTNHTLERGVQVARMLEDYHGFFVQTFAGFFNTPEQIRKLFAGAARRKGRAAKPYEVHYYKTKAEYVARLQKTIPQIAITNGLYLTKTRVAYFFHIPNANNDPTLYHEATHQIFYESLAGNRMIAQRANFWIIEGIACYMESFKRDGNRVTLGDPAYQRFVAARYRFVKDRFYVPLAKFTRIGMLDYQRPLNIRKRYSQASGLTKFFMEYDDGRYRDALIEHLSQLYRAGARRFVRVQPLDRLTGVSFQELDRQYGEFIRNLPASTTVNRGP